MRALDVLPLVALNSKQTALRLGLAKIGHDSFVFGADSTTVLDPAGPGRNSVRLQSKKTFARHVAVFDMRHMPAGCRCAAV